ncbi:MAG: AgmX/PglI C-terminal domain-containing protein [Deltaproteobacteria bacterium]|nr:AgmX/PglI C-terminal domain-containing protein [Deltaproteobacteria bacterium]
MNRSLKVGLLWIAMITVIVAVWLAFQPQPQPTTTTTASGPVGIRAAPEGEDNDSARAPAAAGDRAGPAVPGGNGETVEKVALKKRATRTATAVALQRRLELEVAAAAVVDPLKPTGKLERQAIKDGIGAVKPQIVGCYDQALQQSPELGGTLKVLFEIGADPDDDSRGVVVAGEVDSVMGSPFFEACVLQAIVGAGFPRPEGGGIVKVTYPFTFRSEPDVDAGVPPLVPG